MYVNFSAVKAVMDMRNQQAQQQFWAPGREYRVARVRRGWLGTKWCWLLGRLGQQMILVGKRLEQNLQLAQPSV